MAIGYIHEFQFSDFNNFGNPFFKGNLFSPFFVAAKRWGNNFHTLIYTGPRILQCFNNNAMQLSYNLNTSFHYLISGTKNFIGVEFNKYVNGGEFSATLRPQMRLGIAHNLMIGIVAGIPLNKQQERLSSFLRLIWEPQHKMK